ncbi:MAG: YbaK/EbsC family protein [Anaerolineae bacterium]|nr:YbaK/EbsC family protein [Anaerolineae bacterium]
MASYTHQVVQTALDSLGLDIDIQIFEASTATAPQAARAIGTDLGSIVKSLCFVVDGEPVLVLAAGDHLVDTRKLASLYGVGRKKVRIADAETTMQVTGYDVGGVAPVGHPQPLSILIDSTLRRYNTVYAAAGSANAIFPILLDDLVRVTHGRFVDMAQE